jgi:hypothetical protein
MKKIRRDFTVTKNTQSERQEAQPDLWNVMLAKSYRISIVTGKKAAQDLADKLNIDPWYLDWERGHRNYSRQY